MRGRASTTGFAGVIHVKPLLTAFLLVPIRILRVNEFCRVSRVEWWANIRSRIVGNTHRTRFSTY